MLQKSSNGTSYYRTKLRRFSLKKALSKEMRDPSTPSWTRHCAPVYHISPINTLAPLQPSPPSKHHQRPIDKLSADCLSSESTDSRLIEFRLKTSGRRDDRWACCWRGTMEKTRADK